MHIFLCSTDFSSRCQTLDCKHIMPGFIMPIFLFVIIENEITATFQLVHIHVHKRHVVFNKIYIIFNVHHNFPIKAKLKKMFQSRSFIFFIKLLNTYEYDEKVTVFFIKIEFS